MLILVKKLLTIVVKQRQHSLYQNILKDFRELLKNKSLFFLSENLFVPSEDTISFLLTQFGTEPECVPVWNFSHATLFQDFLQMAGTLGFPRNELANETGSAWFESLQCLTLILLTRLRSDQIPHVIQIIIKLFPNIFKGRKDLLKGIFTIKTFRNFNETYDFCLEHESLLDQNLIHFTKNIKLTPVQSWQGRSIGEINHSPSRGFPNKQARAQQEGLDRNMQEQIEQLRQLQTNDKLRVRLL